MKFASELEGGTLSRLVYKLMRWKKVKKDLDSTLLQLKNAIENQKP